MNKHANPQPPLDCKQDRAGKNHGRKNLPGWPVYDDDEILAAESVLRSGHVNYWTGNEGRRFEEKFSEYIGTEYAIAVCNGSVALGVALKSLQLKPGAEIIVTPRTFVASVNEIVLAGARPVFADVDLDSQNITVESISPLCNEHTAAIMAVHLAGWPCDLPAITALAEELSVPLIEDCAQAHGASVDGCSVGASGLISAFSFCQDKIMTTGGEGGMIVTNDRQLYESSWSMKDHGKNRQVAEEKSNGNVFRWLHDSVGSNYRMTEMQAAIGCIQLEKLDGWVALRKQNAGILSAHFRANPLLRVAVPPAGIEHAYYKYYVFIRPRALKSGWSRERILADLWDSGVPCGSGICPEVYLENSFANTGFRPPERLPVARELGETSIMLPVHPTLSEESMHWIADRMDSVMAEALR